MYSNYSGLMRTSKKAPQTMTWVLWAAECQIWAVWEEETVASAASVRHILTFLFIPNLPPPLHHSPLLCSHLPPSSPTIPPKAPGNKA